MSFILTQTEVDALLALAKHYTGDDPFVFPGLGGVLHIPLYSQDKREEFSLDIRRGSIEIKKNTVLTRARSVIVLARVDLGGPPHRNPDGGEIKCPHIHLYREGYGDRWAKALPDCFSNPNDVWKTIDEFMNFCNIVTKPSISGDLFT